MTIPFIPPSIEPERWEPPTMKSVLQMEGNPLVTCVCGRSVSADMMRPLDESFGCDACYATQIRTGKLTCEEFARSLGAPESVILKAQTQDADRTDDATAVASRASP